ncbi:hypothetical protein HK102_011283, partial [Quaeritorhiza haematococci]
GLPGTLHPRTSTFTTRPPYIISTRHDRNHTLITKTNIRTRPPKACRIHKSTHSRTGRRGSGQCRCCIINNINRCTRSCCERCSCRWWCREEPRPPGRKSRTVGGRQLLAE